MDGALDGNVDDGFVGALDGVVDGVNDHKKLGLLDSFDNF